MLLSSSMFALDLPLFLYVYSAEAGSVGAFVLSPLLKSLGAGEGVAAGSEVFLSVPDSGLHVSCAGDLHDISSSHGVVASTVRVRTWFHALWV